MYVIFEQREPARQGSSFVDSAWDRFYRDLDVVFPPADAVRAWCDPSLLDDEPDGGQDDDLDAEPLTESGAA